MRMRAIGSGRWALGLLVGLLAGALASPAFAVGLWDRYEASLTNGRSYGDPYRDVRLDVVWTRPDGSRIDFHGFYDGGDTWRLRMMCDQLGGWSWSASFSDGAGQASGSFECEPSSLPGKLSRDLQNPYWFGFSSGQPLLVRSFHVGDRFFAANWSAGERRSFLDWAQGQGYNMLSIASHYLNRDASGRGRGWDTPDLWPLDAAEYRRLEGMLDDLEDRGIMVYPFAGFFGKQSDFPRSPGDQTLYIEYTLARLGAYWNLLLNVAGPEPALDNYLSSSEVNRLGAEIAAADVFDHPLSVHNRKGPGDPYKDASWSSYSTLQGPTTTDLSVLLRDLERARNPEKPLYAQETLWSGNQNHPDYSDDQLRKNAWVIMMAAGALNFADMGGPNPGQRGNSSSGFSGSMQLLDRRQGRHDIIRQVWDQLASFPFQRMVPAQDTVSRGYALAEAGQHYLVYLPSGGSVDVDVSGGSFRVEWVNPRQPGDRRDGGTTGDGQGLSAPDGQDWLLHLERAGATTRPAPPVQLLD